MTINLALYTADHERRDQARLAIGQLEAVHKFLQPLPGQDDIMACARDAIADVISDIQGEIDILTDRIGDERGYPFHAPPFGGAHG